MAESTDDDDIIIACTTTIFASLGAAAIVTSQNRKRKRRHSVWVKPYIRESKRKRRHSVWVKPYIRERETWIRFHAKSLSSSDALLAESYKVGSFCTAFIKLSLVTKILVSIVIVVY